MSGIVHVESTDDKLFITLENGFDVAYDKDGMTITSPEREVKLDWEDARRFGSLTRECKTIYDMGKTPVYRAPNTRE